MSFSPLLRKIIIDLVQADLGWKYLNKNKHWEYISDPGDAPRYAKAIPTGKGYKAIGGKTFEHKDWIKSIKGRLWDPDQKAWMVPNDEADNIMDEINKRGLSFIEGAETSDIDPEERANIEGQKSTIMGGDFVAIIGKTFAHKDWIKSIPGRKWNGDERRWEIPVKEYEKLKEEISNRKLGVQILSRGSSIQERNDEEKEEIKQVRDLKSQYEDEYFSEWKGKNKEKVFKTELDSAIRETNPNLTDAMVKKLIRQAILGIGHSVTRSYHPDENPRRAPPTVSEIYGREKELTLHRVSQEKKEDDRSIDYIKEYMDWLSPEEYQKLAADIRNSVDHAPQGYIGGKYVDADSSWREMIDYHIAQKQKEVKATGRLWVNGKTKEETIKDMENYLRKKFPQILSSKSIEDAGKSGLINLRKEEAIFMRMLRGSSTVIEVTGDIEHSYLLSGESRIKGAEGSFSGKIISETPDSIKFLPSRGYKSIDIPKTNIIWRSDQ